MTFRKMFAALLLTAAVLAPGNLLAQQPNWSTAINPLSPEAQQIRRQDLLDRPNRPGHVYGNTLRRMHHQGHPLPVRFGGMFRR